MKRPLRKDYVGEPERPCNEAYQDLLYAIHMYEFRVRGKFPKSAERREEMAQCHDTRVISVSEDVAFAKDKLMRIDFFVYGEDLEEDDEDII